MIGKIGDFKNDRKKSTILKNDRKKWTIKKNDRKKWTIKKIMVQKNKLLKRL